MIAHSNYANHRFLHNLQSHFSPESYRMISHSFCLIWGRPDSTISRPLHLPIFAKFYSIRFFNKFNFHMNLNIYISFTKTGEAWPRC